MLSESHVRIYFCIPRDNLIIRSNLELTATVRIQVQTLLTMSSHSHCEYEFHTFNIDQSKNKPQ